jgi:non-specific serine/threonine protein kinase/protein-serine/threonine kinase
MRIDRLEPGQVIDGFRLGEKLHQGGMAVIWQVSAAEGPGPGFPLVMKIPLIDDADDPTLIVGFEVEQMILPTLSGPHVPRFVKNGDFAVQPHVVMEHLKGQSLFRLAEGKLPLPWKDAVDLVARVASALDALHRQRVIHLDLKPANLFQKDDGTIAFLDFGLSHAELLPDLLSEEFRLPLGTGPYMAPEQVMGVRTERRSDLFALGVMLYEFTTGALPFGSPTTKKGLRERLWRDPVPPRALNSEIPDWLQEVMLKLLAVNPAERLPSAALAAFQLRNPAQVTLTRAGQRMKRDGFATTLRRRWNASSLDFASGTSTTGGLAAAPIIAVAVDLSHDPGPLEETVARAARRVALSEPDARIACLSVLKTSRIGVDFATNDQGENYRVLRLIGLRDWSRTLEFPPERITHHVLEGTDPADALIDFCRNNGVEHLVMGARAASAVRRYLGSVSARVVAEAPCSVTVVRLPAAAAGAEDIESVGKLAAE